AIPCPLDVVRTTRTVDHSQRRPNRMIASEDKAIVSAAQDGVHAAAVGFNTGGFSVVEPASVNCTPEISVEFEIRAAPFAAHRSEEILEVFLNFRMSSVEHVPRPAPPSAECYLVRL